MDIPNETLGLQVQANNSTAEETKTVSTSATSQEPNAAPQVDEFQFGLLMNRVMGSSNSRRPSDKDANDVQVDILLNQANGLSRMNDQYTETFVVKGTKALYDLIGAFYSYALQINESPLKEHTIQRMREKLEKEHDIKTQANTPWITTVVRFIMPKDRQTAYNYAKVLQVAFDENLTAAELPTYIKDRGGITRINGTKEEQENRKAVKAHKEAKVTMLRKILLANAVNPALETKVMYDDVIQTTPKGQSESEFDFAVCVRMGDSTTKIIRFFSVSDELENTILRAITDAQIDDDLTKMQGKLDKLRAHYGIKRGWGMLPGDKGYDPEAITVLNIGEKATPKPIVMPESTLPTGVEPEAMLNAPLANT